MSPSSNKSKENQTKTSERALRTFAFIDSQNLNLGTQKMGWKLDWRKFRKYLKDQYGVSKAYTFIGYMSENEQLYEYMHNLGYLVVLKRTTSVAASPESKEAQAKSSKKEEKEKVPVKGNVDVELVLYAMKEISNYDRAIIVSGDGDFYSLLEYLDDKGKLYKIITPNWQYSSLLKTFETKMVCLDKLKRNLHYRDRK